ncbi:MAG: beta-lactamase family protein [Anaerolineae bacterium]|nr:beta-lactamase family protein [Anaerolineae bacterium]
MQRLLLVSAPLALLLLGWVGYVHYLTVQEESACVTAVGDLAENDNMVKAKELQDVLNRYSDERDGVGLQATVVQPDGAVWSGVSGYANREKRCPMTHNHHLYVGSITKLYTAALVMDQVEKGTISLDDTLGEWVDLSYADSVTVRMLLNHTSGVPSYTEDAWFLARYFGLPRKNWQSDELVRVISRKPLEFDPGSQHKYSNSNYLLLGVILETATGETYQALLEENIARQQGFDDTSFLAHDNGAVIANAYDDTLLHLGTRNLTGFRRSMASGAFSAGGILSNSEDVALFAHRLFTGQIVTDSTLDQMTTFIETPDEDMPLQAGYGLGVRNLIVGGENLFGHTGSIPGYSGIVMHNPEKRYTIAVLSNLSIIDQTGLLEEIQNACLLN